MRVAELNSLDVKACKDKIFSTIKEGNIIRLVRLNPNLEVVDEIARFKGSKAFILKAEKPFLISVDDCLILVEEGFQKKVLTASAPENFFWHSTEAQGHVFIQEYGCSPTGIYVSKDLENWRRIASNVELDRHSRHFHSIAWDPYRNWLLASLGDGCLARVVQSEDLGQSWKILYRGAWQFIPIVACEDKVIFGMDSGIAKGGVGIFHPENCCWEFKFFKWLNGKSLSAQMCDLKLLNNSLWIAAFGVPQAIALSRDLRTWYPVHIESYDGNFNFHMLIGETGNAVLCSTGNHLIAVGKDELDLVVMSKNSIASPYKAYKERLEGFIFILKRKIKNKRLGHD